MATWFDNIPAKITAKLEGWWTAIKTWFTDLPKKFEIKDAGKKMVQELTGGATGQQQDMIDKVGDLVVKVLLAIPAIIAVTAIAAGIYMVRRIVEGVERDAETVKTAVVSAIAAAWDAIANMSFPHIPLPHLKIKGSFDLKPPGLSVPSVGVDWYAKGGVFNQPAVIGVGDVPEAVIPLSKLSSILGESLSGVPLSRSVTAAATSSQQAISRDTHNNGHTFNITVNATPDTDGHRIGRDIRDELEDITMSANLLVRST